VVLVSLTAEVGLAFLVEHLVEKSLVVLEVVEGHAAPLGL
jgi:hypothetical protein